MKTIKIDNSTETGKFKQHLSDVSNKRILVTAPFGAGKSYFLKEFFSSQQQYLPVTLFPGDYSVSSNEDIFELIKYDIIDALMACYPEKLNLQSNDFSTLLLAQQFLAKEADFMPLFKAVAQSQSLGLDSLFEIFESTKALYQKFTGFREDMNDEEIKLLKSYMLPFEQKRGSVREYDAITQFIAELLERIKTTDAGSDEQEAAESPAKQTILVVDDLDRLEADQIFRIFNIFSAHYDSREDANKFGFDKVILVCDLDNLEYMFRHRYGAKANFDGYIDKFYSYTPFIFNLQSFLRDKSSEYLLFIDDAHAKPELLQSAINDKRFGQKSVFFQAISGLTEAMIDQSLLRARNFQKFKGYELSEWQITIGHRSYNSRHFPLLIMASMLLQLFPRVSDPIRAIDDLAAEFPSDYDIKTNSGHKNFLANLVSYALPFLVEDFNEIANRRSGDKDHLCPIVNEVGQKVFIVFNVKESFEYDQTDLIYSKVVRDGNLINDRCPEPAVSYPNFYYFLSVALKHCVRNGYL